MSAARFFLLHRLLIFVLSLGFSLGFCGIPTQALAWDEHHLITERALIQIGALQNEKLQPENISDFISDAFRGCSDEQFYNSVVGGVGKDYHVRFVDRVEASIAFSPDLFNVQNQFNYILSACQPNQSCQVSAAATLATYSDEPDWNMDVDVAQLRGVGIAKGVSGTGTQVLRHFWFEPGHYYSEGLDTLKHAERLFLISQAAFASGHRYWGYRFLANAIHYLQDLTQPFHVEPVPSMDMPRSWELLSASLCEKVKRDRLKHPEDPVDPRSLASCNEKSLTYSQAEYLSGLVVSVYHIMYESYARAMILNPAMNMSTKIDGELSVATDRFDHSPLTWTNGMGDADMPSAMNLTAARIRRISGKMGDDILTVFSGKYKADKNISLVLSTAYSELNPGYLLAFGKYNVWNSRKAAFARLDAITQDILSWTGELTREFVSASQSQTLEKQNKALKSLQSLCPH